MHRVVDPGPSFDPATTQETVAIACADVVQAVAFAHLSEAIFSQAPGLRLHALPTQLGTFANLRADEAQMAVGVYGRLDPDIEQQMLPAEPFVTLFRAGHPALDRPWDVQSYAGLDHVLVAPRGTRGGTMDAALAELGVERRITRWVSSFLAAPRYVRTTDLVVTLPVSVTLGLDRAAFAWRQPPPPLDRSIPMSVIWHRRRSSDAVIHYLTEELQRAFRKVLAPPAHRP